MPWSTALENIVTESVLGSRLSNYTLKSETAAATNLKLDITNGTAHNLQLADNAGTPNSAASYGQVTTITDDIYEKLADKASLNSANFTQPITGVPGQLNTNITVNSQLLDYVLKTGGDITGAIRLTDPDAVFEPGHLATIKYVTDRTGPLGTSLANKADLIVGADFVGPVTVPDPPLVNPNDHTAANLKYVDAKVQAGPTITTASLDDYSDKIATTKFVADKIEEALINDELILGAAVAATPNADDDSDRIATTEWVREYIAQVLGG